MSCVTLSPRSKYNSVRIWFGYPDISFPHIHPQVFSCSEDHIRDAVCRPHPNSASRYKAVCHDLAGNALRLSTHILYQIHGYRIGMGRRTDDPKSITVQSVRVRLDADIQILSGAAKTLSGRLCRIGFQQDFHIPFGFRSHLRCRGRRIADPGPLHSCHQPDRTAGYRL